MESKKYGVKELANLSGVSIRTLHHYDKIGLLKPSSRTEAGYRYYEEKELLRLQQILFYKELDFPLKEIGLLLDDPDFDHVKALQQHRKALENRQKRISSLLETIDSTIDHLKTGTIMTDPEMLYEGLPKEMGTSYRQEAIDEYGEEVVSHAEQELMKLGKDGFKQLQADFEQLNQELFATRNEPCESSTVQQLIARHYKIIRQFWGTSNSEDNQAEAYAGLGTLYVNDPRFTKVNGKEEPEFAEFLKKAMEYYAKMELGLK